VNPAAWPKFNERLAKAAEVLSEARKLPEKDPMFWDVALHVALGQGWEKPKYDSLVAEAVAFEPKFWRYDIARAKSLLPRWYGKEGDWEAYAKTAAAHPGGLGPEAYARIVISLTTAEDTSEESIHVDWPTARAGLEQMLKSYPRSLDIVHTAAHMACLRKDREFAKRCFDLIGSTYLPDHWDGRAEMEHYRQWAQTP